MRERNGLRRHKLPLAGLLVLLTAIPAVPAVAQEPGPGLPRTYDVQVVDSPDAVGGGAFGWGIYSSDLTGDGKHDLLVAQSQVGTREQPNRIFIFDGDSGAHIDTIAPPEDNPDATYASPELGFVYVETMPDLGSCPGGDGPDAGRICDQPAVAPGDGIPEILVGARALRVDPVDGNLPPDTSDPRVGRGYVIDGATRAVLKRIDMPAADRQTHLARAGANSVAAFARTMSSPQGLPPCAGSRAENNDAGVGPCPDESDRRYPRAVRIGDVNGGGQPDIVITARSFLETGDVIRNDGTVIPGSAPAGTQCRNNVRRQAAPTTAVPNPPVPAAATCTAGKVWVYAGEMIAGTNPEQTLDTTLHAPSATLPNGGIQNPDAQTGGGEFGGNMFRVGDVTGPSTAAPAAGQPDLRLPDGVPDFVIPARSHDIPLRNPDPDAGLNVGSAYLFSGSNGALIRRIVSPEPQIRSQFSGSFNAGRAVGDLGATGTPDILLPAAFHNAHSTDDGRLWAFNGDTTAGGGGEGSWNLATLSDPEPQIGGNFGGAQTGVGNLVGGPDSPANEVLIGGFHFDLFTEASDQNVTNLNFMNATMQRNLMTVPHPTGTHGDGFGVGITPMGDLNGDGFLDFSASAYLANIRTGGSGRAFIFRSNNSPPPPPPTEAPQVATGPAAASAGGERPLLVPGRCANRSLGTDGIDRMGGTIAGDEIFAFAGDDVVSGFQGGDCLDGGGGNDKLDGDEDNDRLVGGGGGDTLSGGDDRDEVFGEAGDDALFGGFGRDRLAGGFGNDRLVGGADADRLFGEAGKDRILGGSGRNLIDAGAGNDSIEARNGRQVDTVYCGTGRDRVRADGRDRVGADCEVVYIGRSKKPSRIRRSRG